MQRYRPYDNKRLTKERNSEEFWQAITWIIFGCTLAFPILALLT